MPYLINAIQSAGLNKLVVSFVVVIFNKVVCGMVLFFWSSLLLHIAAICIILLRMGLQLQRLSFPHQLLFKKLVLKTSDVIYYFRVKSSSDYQMSG